MEDGREEEWEGKRDWERLYRGEGKEGERGKEGKGRVINGEGKVSNEVQRGVDRRKSRKNDVQGRRMSKIVLMEICFL